MAAPVLGPMVPAAGTVLNMAGGFSGIRDFITGVRAVFGKGGDFAERNGFEYGNIYNSLLQYNVLQAFETSESNKMLKQITEKIAAVDGDEKVFYGVLFVQLWWLILLSSLPQTGRAKNKASMSMC